jgi:multiple antibiotic resistance protein
MLSLSTFLLTFTALFSILNPPSSALIFFSATQRFDHAFRRQIANWVAIYGFVILMTSLYVGAYVLEFFGISIPVLQVAGGIVIAMTAWQMLNAPEERQQRQRTRAIAAKLPPQQELSASRVAFYPFAMPLTTGPGTISVAISLGATRPPGFGPELASFVAQTLVAATLMIVMIWIFYRNAGRIARLFGSTGTVVVLRLTAFLLFCIGIQVFWNGAVRLLATV